MKKRLAKKQLKKKIEKSINEGTASFRANLAPGFKQEDITSEMVTEIIHKNIGRMCNPKYDVDLKEIF